ncbi:MAG: hypothetical protein ACD_65C00048G0002 [uncultured bacterium]|nr:MAG: hypothetical protein ACD_65C00048G0002 [uncultured bacterium]
MLKNQNSFGLREARLVWKNGAKIDTPAYSVGTMAEQIDVHVKEKKLTLDETDRTKLDAYKQEKGQIIFWNARERQKFANEIGATNADAKELGARIEHEIQTEIFESQMDASAKNDYEGADENLDSKDKNPVRQIIETAYDQNTRGLTPTQRGALDQAILAKIGHSHDHGEHISFGVFKDLMVTEKEAGEIAKFIETEASKVKKASEAGKPKTKDTLQKEMSDAEKILQTGFTKPEWYKADTAINKDVKETVDEKIKNDQIIKEFAKCGITASIEQVKNSLAKILSSAHAKNGISGLKATEALGNKIQGRGDALLNWATKRYPKNSAEVVDKILTSKKIDKNNVQSVLEYLAFGNVEDDMKAAENYFETKNKLENDASKKVETNEAVKAQDAKPETEKATEAKGFDSVKKDFDALMGAINKGDWGEAFLKFFEMLGSLFKFAGSFILGAIPASAEGIPLIGEKYVKPLRAWAKSSGGDDKKTEKGETKNGDQTATSEKPKTKEKIVEKATERLNDFGFNDKNIDLIGNKTVLDVIGMPSNSIWGAKISKFTFRNFKDFQKVLEKTVPEDQRANKTIYELVANLSYEEWDKWMILEPTGGATSIEKPTPSIAEKSAEESAK